MVRVCIVLGPAQLFFLMAALRMQRRHSASASEDHLVLAGAGVSDSRKAVTEQLARVAWEWKSITWASDLLNEQQIRPSSKPSQFVPPLMERLGHIKADEVWVCRAGGLAEKVLMLAWPKATLVLCDDGLAAYLSHDPSLFSLLTRPRAFARKLMALASVTAYRVGLDRSPESHHWPKRRFERAFNLLGNLPSPNHEPGTERITVDREETLAVVRAVQQALALPEYPAHAPRRVLVLGQYFHQFGNMSWEEELGIYTDVCKRVAERGFPVLWKEHPKAPKPFFPHLREAVPGIEAAGVEGHFSWPIEFFADRLGLDACICGTSTCLFTLEQIYGMKTYTYAADLVEKLVGADRDVARLAARHAKPFEAFLTAQSTPAAARG